MALIGRGAAFMNVGRRRKERVYRNLELKYCEAELHERFRFGRESLQFLCNMLRGELERPTSRNHSLSVEKQVLITLRFLASGSFLQVVGDTVGAHKSSVSRAVHSVVDALNQKADQFITWPVRKKEKVIEGFSKLGGFPNVLGCIDGTHIRIQAPNQEEASYVNRKQWHSINVQAVCDHQGKITNITANWPGSAHDSHIFRTSQLCQYLEQTHHHMADGFVLGDSGYPCRPFLLTPYLNPQTPSQQKFNDNLCRTRVTVERTFGRLKRRFHILHSEIRMQPSRVCKIIIACAVLHNIAIMRNEPLLVEDVRPHHQQPLREPNRGGQDGKAIRDHIANTYFNNLLLMSE